MLKSFEPRIYFFSHWIRALVAGTATALVFVPWDIYFTHLGIWGFSSSHILGAKLAGLPVEEWLFFWVMPFACIFIYECMKLVSFHNTFMSLVSSKYSIFFASVVLAVLAMIHRDKTYTLWAFAASSIVLLSLMRLTSQQRSQLLLAFGVCLLPFYVVNSILTGAISTEPVVWYNDRYNLGLRVGTIPIEDHFYMFAHLVPSFVIFDLINRSVLLESKIRLHRRT